LCVYICHYIFPFYYLDIYLFFIFFIFFSETNHYYIKVVESIQFVCTGNSGISWDLCNANTYRSIHEGLFFNSSPTLGFKYPFRLPYIHFYLFASFTLYKSWPPFINISINQIDSYILVVGEATLVTWLTKWLSLKIHCQCAILYIMQVKWALFGKQFVPRIFWQIYNLLPSSHTDGYLFFLHIVSTFRVTHLHTTNEDLLNIKRKDDTKSWTLSRMSDTTETQNLCVIKVILIACSTYIFLSLFTVISSQQK
jgi:hypothetical protein